MNTYIFKKKIEYSFDKYADKYDSRTFLQKEIMYVLLHFLYQEISATNKKKNHLLDLGCGTGELSNILIKKSLNFTRYFLQNKFFIPNNILFPKSRVILENYFN